MVGLAFAVVGICSALVGGLLVKPLVAAIGERLSLVAGLLCGAAGMALFGIATQPALFWIGIPIMSLMGLATPALQGLMTARVQNFEQGELQGAIGSVGAIAQMIGPIMFSFVFAQSISATPFLAVRIPGAPFFCAAAILAVAALLSLQTKSPEASLPPGPSTSHLTTDD
jgi:DHA1 family tetracycline resistance protein-like MFS transporter